MNQLVSIYFSSYNTLFNGSIGIKTFDEQSEKRTF